MQKPLVSICIPTVRRLEYLKEAVASGLAQTYENIEVLVSQDIDRTTGTLEAQVHGWCVEMTRQDPRFRHQVSSRPLGLSGNWNALVDGARGEFVNLIGDDDRLLPQFVELLMNAKSDRTVVLFSDHYLIDHNGVRDEHQSRQFSTQYHRAEMPAGILSDAEEWIWQNAIPITAALIRTKNARSARFRDDLNCPEIEAFLRLAKQGAEFVFVPEYLAEYRFHANQETSAGLTTERLAKYLIEIEATPNSESYKQAFLARLLPNAVTRCMQSNNMAEARALLHCRYYPRQQNATTMLQSFCSRLPDAAGIQLYKLAHEWKSKFRIRR